MYRLCVKLFIGLLTLMPIVPAHLGSGDSVRPRDTESVIESVVPALPSGVDVDIVGSDTFVRVRAAGHRVEVPGYEGEPYLRIDADGVVSVNDASKTALLNGDRYGDVDLSTFVESDDPVWRVVATDGTAMWHDHRSHWMSPKPPAPINDRGTVQTWVVPMTVDGRATEVNGTLYLRHRASVIWWLLGLVAVFVTIALSLIDRSRMKVVLLVLSLAGAFTGALQYFGLPDGARVTPLLLVFSGLAVLSCTGAFVRWGTNDVLRVALATGGFSFMVIAAWLCADHVQAAYIPGIDARWLARSVIPMMLGAGIAGTIEGVVHTLTRK